ncbi:MAG: hypothetical protein H5T61_09315 [Thermoflexales bacterium]|nr:hypothetical protein [Thermoflexales bacterium]
MSEQPQPIIQREESLRQAYNTVQQMSLGKREAEVKLALKALLVIRGSIRLPETPEARRKTLQRLYPAIAKYVRASEAKTLGELVNEVIGALSPDWSFVSHKALGDPVEDIYREDENSSEALRILKEETVPLVILMKKIYQSFIAPEEAIEEE